MAASGSSVSIAILGASGYTGAELIRLLRGHPHARLSALSADSQAGKPMAAIYPHLAGLGLPDAVPQEAIDFSGVEVVFCCLPHGTTQDVIAALPKHLKIIDLSADFRLADTEEYATWYGHAHRAPALQREAVYGLSEIHRERIRQARLVANPGCYPTGAQLPLIPLLKARLIAAEGMVIDSKSGVTGAGRAAKQAALYTEVSGGISAYGIGAHRHTPEIEQGLSEAAGAGVQVRFTPHLAPMNRGILSTIYVKLAPGKSVADLRAALQAAYANEPFVRVGEEGEPPPSTHAVRGTNACVIGVFADRVAGHAVLVSAIDNLVKGASGQAVQNFNLMMGFPETLALESLALFP